MPFYKFICTKCNHKFEELATISEKESKAVSCPNCKSNDLSTEISAPGIVVKGKACENSHQCGCNCPHNHN